MRQITFAPTFTGWQRAARHAVGEHCDPGSLVWQELDAEQPTLPMFEERESTPSADERFRVPRAFIQMASHVACHRDAQRWALLYRVLWRLTHGEPRLIEIVVDPDVHELLSLEKAVRHDLHKMRAFVRFREVRPEPDAGINGETASPPLPPWYVAWFEPAHYIVEANAPFFVDRFAGMCWSILTPDRCAHWNGRELSFTAGVPKSEAPRSDAVENLWLRYYSHIFNPARVKVRAMQAEMPKRYWKNLPEAAVIPALLNQAPSRVSRMLAASKGQQTRDDEYGVAQPPSTGDWSELRAAAAGCRACPLWRDATQTVFGEGPQPADVLFLGEQPGDSEDLTGKPFIGPAGKLFDGALAEAGIDRSRVYVTNTVKHFKWEPRGKRRIHQKPNSRDIAACRPWLEAELRVIRPRVLVCLGATAAGAVCGSQVRILRDRGAWRESDFAARTLITFHPSALLRAPDEATREQHYEQFVSDLQLIAREIATAARR